jgi:hypothetical protein
MDTFPVDLVNAIIEYVDSYDTARLRVVSSLQILFHSDNLAVYDALMQRDLTWSMGNYLMDVTDANEDYFTLHYDMLEELEDYSTYMRHVDEAISLFK